MHAFKVWRIRWRRRLLPLVRSRKLWSVVLLLLPFGSLLGAGLLFAYLKGRPSSTGRTSALLKNVEMALAHYQIDGAGSCPETLEALYTRGYLGQRPRDPWGTPLDYRCRGNPLQVELTSAGPDQELGTDDDISLPRASR